MVSGRVAKSKKYGPGRFRSGNGRFHQGLNSEIDDFWDGRQLQETWSYLGRYGSGKVDLIKERITKSMVSGSAAMSTK